MEKTSAASSTILKTVDLSPFLKGGDVSCRQQVIDTISEACSTLGAFQIANPNREQCEKLLELTKEFFSFPDDVKKDSTKKDLDMAGSGYGKLTDGIYHDYEYILMYAPDKHFNGVPTIQPDYKKTYDNVFDFYVRTSQILEEILNESLGLPTDFLKNYNNDRCWDYMLPMHYTVSTETDNIGICDHEDPNMFTIILQDDVSGLEIFLNGEWVPIIPEKGNLIVIMCDLMQVLSNKKYKTATHRAFKNKGSKRLAIDFVYSFAPQKWVEPIQELTTEVGVKPVYRGFKNSEFIDLVNQDYITPPPTVEDFVDISYFEIKSPN